MHNSIITNNMSTAALQGLLDYLYGTLTPGNMRWVGEHLIEQANTKEAPLKPYTMDEVNAMLDRAEQEIQEGKGVPSEEVFRALELEFETE